jgi:hypothetical protein
MALRSLRAQRHSRAAHAHRSRLARGHHAPVTNRIIAIADRVGVSTNELR